MKLAVIVGGSAGLGLALAEQLAVEGVRRVVLVARNAQRLENVATQLHQKFPNTTFEVCAVDISTALGSETLAASVASQAEPIDLLVNAVGLSDRGTILGLKAERLQQLISANIVGPLMSAQALVPQMQAGSIIINIGSLSSLFAPSYLGGYSIVKHGLRALTQQLRMELRTKGIHVMLACPGPIAREDTGSRYSHLESAAEIPANALQGGGGAKLKGLDPHRLAADILQAARTGKLEIIRPRKARLLFILSAMWPKLAESILRRQTT